MLTARAITKLHDGGYLKSPLSRHLKQEGWFSSEVYWYLLTTVGELSTIALKQVDECVTLETHFKHSRWIHYCSHDSSEHQSITCIHCHDIHAIKMRPLARYIAHSMSDELTQIDASGIHMLLELAKYEYRHIYAIVAYLYTVPKNKPVGSIVTESFVSHLKYALHVSNDMTTKLFAIANVFLPRLHIVLTTVLPQASTQASIELWRYVMVNGYSVRPLELNDSSFVGLVVGKRTKHAGLFHKVDVIRFDNDVPSCVTLPSQWRINYYGSARVCIGASNVSTSTYILSKCLRHSYAYGDMSGKRIAISDDLIILGVLAPSTIFM